VEHSARTLSVQEKQMHDTEKKEKFRIYGELINTYGYGLEPGAKTLECINYYDNEPISIPLDPTLTPGENAVHYFDRYNKLKRTADALTDRIEETEKEIDQLDNISNALQIARDENDLSQIRQELVDYGFIRHKQTDSKRKKSVSKPLHYVSSDGFDIYVGKNNYQNEEVSFKMASGSDWWFHAKKMPGSHVIVKANGREVPDRTFEEAGALAAFYSSGKNAPKVEVDYTLKKNLRKPNGARPGFVVYYTNYSLMCIPDISGIREES
ncbi:MAG: NFACT family protein, partial [Eubacterium sp.]|nr:NFACT family protein [Eubacterium sp.]